jgi:glyoxylase-like metal-dependent hydrolase (beta-lactamase superfamily II)
MIVKNFVVGPLRTDSYLVYLEHAHEAVLIDPARGKDKIKTFAESQGLKVVAALLTHGHFDHIGNAAAWQDEGAKIYIHTADAGMLAGKGNLSDVFGAACAPCKADVLVEDGMTVFEAGITFRVIHTPGHSPGSCCYIAENCMFCGDTLFAGGGYGRTDLEGGNSEMLRASIRRLFALPSDYILCPGHGEETTLEKEKIYNVPGLFF